MTDRPGRDGGWVLAQIPLIGLALVLGRAGPRLPAPFSIAARPFGLAIIAAGMVLFGAGLAALGRDLTPFPRPKEGARLVRSGPYRLVRNPLYAGGILASLGNALWHGRPLGLVGTALLFLFFDAKATREEEWLEQQFPDFPAYRRSTRKLVPGLY